MLWKHKVENVLYTRNKVLIEGEASIMMIKFVVLMCLLLFAPMMLLHSGICLGQLVSKIHNFRSFLSYANQDKNHATK